VSPNIFRDTDKAFGFLLVHNYFLPFNNNTLLSVGSELVAEFAINMLCLRLDRSKVHVWCP